MKYSFELSYITKPRAWFNGTICQRNSADFSLTQMPSEPFFSVMCEWYPLPSIKGRDKGSQDGGRCGWTLRGAHYWTSLLICYLTLVRVPANLKGTERCFCLHSWTKAFFPSPGKTELLFTVTVNLVNITARGQIFDSTFLGVFSCLYCS